MVTSLDPHHPHSHHNSHYQEDHDRLRTDAETPQGQGGQSSAVHPSSVQRESSFTMSVRPGQLPKISAVPSSSVVKVKSGHMGGPNKRGSVDYMGVPGVGLPVLEKGKVQMIAWGENSNGQGGTWQGSGNDQGQGLGSAPGQGLEFRPVNNNLAEGQEGQGQLRHKRPLSANPHAHQRNSGLIHTHTTTSSNNNNHHGDDHDGGHGHTVAGGKRHAFAGVAEASAVSGALLRITDALVRKVLPWNSVCCPRAVENLRDLRLQIILAKYDAFVAKITAQLQTKVAAFLTCKEGELASWLDNEATSWTHTTNDEEIQLTAFFKTEKERSMSRLESQASALRMRETMLAMELDGR